MRVYNKLVRDRIPEIIAKSGDEYRAEILSDDVYKTMLEVKAAEELEEYRQANTRTERIEELADVLEVIYSLAGANGCSVEKLETVRKKKKEQKGGFSQKIFLQDVIENKK
ncbi:nucleoside triphosphate pyrophosphohydrolase [Pseudalkalibacillus sp. SCS-8]|uniref:nucleoside triphosphate pyrophosphohydrolase n=1 Tax=Pseudalkalibacillus nanhaiensis TaxID=3115291 RepID=UPI0032DAE8A1